MARERILIVGCGDVGLRLVRLITPRWRIYALVRDPGRFAALRAHGVIPIPGDLDDPASLTRIAGLAPWVVHLAPPPADGEHDPRTRNLLGALGAVERLVYVSTSGVYGDCAGALVDETRPVAPQTSRARRRVDAEEQLRRWARRRRVQLAILRAPGIYALDRLPVTRLKAATPILRTEEDVHSNHIHADDLARLILVSLTRGAALRVYNASDSSDLLMGAYFEKVATALGLPLPPRVSRSELSGRVSPAALSFMEESRRLSNRRVLAELGVRLAYPRVDDALALLAGTKAAWK